MIKLVIVLIILQSVLGQITATPAPTTYRYFVFTEECYQTLIIEKDLFHFECLKKVFHGRCSRWSKCWVMEW